MLRVENLTKSFGGQALFDSVDWMLGDFDRVGLIGRNGTGKSTLLRMLAGLDSPDSGKLIIPKGITVGYLPQFGFEAGEGTVREAARGAFASLLGLRGERDAIAHRLSSDGDMASSEAEPALQRHADLDERFRALGGYEIDRKVHQVLTGLGFSEGEFDRQVRTLSGGWQMRVALARLLLGGHQVLLLDEPTNHLDLEARIWLEDFLRDYPGSFVIVSHDRHFLDRTIRRIAEIQSRRLIDYTGTYSDYRVQREARYELALKAYARQQEEIARIERFIERFRAKNTKASQVQSRIRMMEKMERLPPPAPPVRAIHFRFPQPEPPGRVVLRLSNIEKAYDNHVVFRGVDLLLERGEKVALVGPNGAGKSTLMRILAGVEPLQGGRRETGLRVTLELFAQDQADRLPPDQTLIDEASHRAPLDLVPQVRHLLGAFLFRGDEVEKRIRVLSGGERNRYALMLMLLSPTNLLLLDEPTNHLDIEAQEVLLAALRAFEGTVVFVSHDHHFISHLATRILEVGGGGIVDHPGDYESYRWKKERTGPAAGDAPPPPVSAAAPGGTRPESAGRPKEERRRARRVAELESAIAEREERRARIEELIQSDGFYRDAEKSRYYLEEHARLLLEINRSYEEWHRLHEDP